MIAPAAAVEAGLTECRLCGAAPLIPRTRLQRATLYDCPQCGASLAAYASHRRDAVAESSALELLPDLQESAGSAPDHFAGLDLESYFRSVKATRLRAAEQLLERVKPFCPTGRWLDVGCSWGWLLTTAKEHGFQAEGIEPSAPAAAAASAAGHTIHHGLFPQALPHAARYHVISLMDVLEHLDDPVAALQAARAALEPRGVLVLQVPDRGCFLYRLAHWLHMASGGRCSFALARLWLLDFDFPHQTYFTRPALVRLLEQQGWQILEQWRSPLGRPTEALDRVRYTRSNQGLPITDALVALGVAGIQVLDNACGHGGLLNVLATPREAHPC